MKPACEVLKRDAWEVRDVPLAVAQALVQQFHYARGGSNTRVFTHGLFKRGELVPLGVAWWIPPTKGAAINTFPEGDWRRVLSLSRLAIHPEVPQNGASFLIGQSIRLIRATKAWDCLVTYADDYQGHEGRIYRATNWQYLGKTNAEATWLDSTGRLVARKAGPRTRTKTDMEALGFRCLGRFAKHKFRIVLRAPKIAFSQGETLSLAA